jgi:hypothetical protein
MSARVSHKEMMLRLTFFWFVKQFHLFAVLLLLRFFRLFACLFFLVKINCCNLFRKITSEKEHAKKQQHMLLQKFIIIIFIVISFSSNIELVVLFVIFVIVYCVV